MENNMSNSLANKSLLCIFCEQRFSTNEEMMHHMLSHNVTKPFLCLECNKRFAYKGALKNHKSIVH